MEIITFRLKECETIILSKPVTDTNREKKEQKYRNRRMENYNRAQAYLCKIVQWYMHNIHYGLPDIKANILKIAEILYSKIRDDIVTGDDTPVDSVRHDIERILHGHPMVVSADCEPNKSLPSAYQGACGRAFCGLYVRLYKLTRRLRCVCIKYI